MGSDKSFSAMLLQLQVNNLLMNLEITGPKEGRWHQKPSKAKAETSSKDTQYLFVILVDS